MIVTRGLGVPGALVTRGYGLFIIIDPETYPIRAPNAVYFTSNKVLITFINNKQTYIKRT